MQPKELDFSLYNERIGMYYADNLLWNSVENRATIKSEAEAGRPVCITSLDRRSGPAIVVGSGPSLDTVIDKFKDFPGAIFCGPSQVKILDNAKRLPDFVVAIDTHPIVAEQLKGPIFTDTMLISHQAIDPLVSVTWKGPRRWLKIQIGQEPMDAAFPWLHSRFVAHGCTANASIQLAIAMGYSPILLCGVDYGYPNGLKRCTDYNYRGAYTYEKLPAVSAPITPFEENGIPTTREMMYYKLLLLHIWKRSHARLITLGGGGCLTELPHIGWELANVELPYLPYDEIDRICDTKMIPFGLYTDSAGFLHRPGDLQVRVEQLERELEGLNEALSPWMETDKGWCYHP